MATTHRDPGAGGCATPAATIFGTGAVLAAAAAALVLALASGGAEAAPPAPAVQICYATAAGSSRCGERADLPPAAGAADQEAITEAAGATAGAMVGDLYVEPGGGDE